MFVISIYNKEGDVIIKIGHARTHEAADRDVQWHRENNQHILKDGEEFMYNDTDLITQTYTRHGMKSRPL